MTYVAGPPACPYPSTINKEKQVEGQIILRTYGEALTGLKQQAHNGKHEKTPHGYLFSPCRRWAHGQRGGPMNAALTIVGSEGHPFDSIIL